MYCRNCGTKIRDNAAFCSKCGTPVKFSQNPQTPPGHITRHRTYSSHSTPTLSTRNTTTSFIIANFIMDIVLGFGLGIPFLVRSAQLYQSYWYRSDAETLERVGIFLIILATLEAAYHFLVARTCADVYADRISGNGLQGVQGKSFDLRNDQIANISISKGFLNIETGACVYLVIDTAAGSYKVLTSKPRAEEILEHFTYAVR